MKTTKTMKVHHFLCTLLFLISLQVQAGGVFQAPSYLQDKQINISAVLHIREDGSVCLSKVNNKPELVPSFAFTTSSSELPTNISPCQKEDEQHIRQLAQTVTQNTFFQNTTPSLAQPIVWDPIITGVVGSCMLGIAAYLLTPKKNTPPKRTTHNEQPQDIEIDKVLSGLEVTTVVGTGSFVGAMSGINILKQALGSITFYELTMGSVLGGIAGTSSALLCSSAVAYIIQD